MNPRWFENRWFEIRHNSNNFCGPLEKSWWLKKKHCFIPIGQFELFKSENIHMIQNFPQKTYNSIIARFPSYKSNVVILLLLLIQTHTFHIHYLWFMIFQDRWTGLLIKLVMFSRILFLYIDNSRLNFISTEASLSRLFMLRFCRGTLYRSTSCRSVCCRTCAAAISSLSLFILIFKNFKIFKWVRS